MECSIFLLQVFPNLQAIVSPWNLEHLCRELIIHCVALITMPEPLCYWFFVRGNHLKLWLCIIVCVCVFNWRNKVRSKLNGTFCLFHNLLVCVCFWIACVHAWAHVGGGGADVWDLIERILAMVYVWHGWDITEMLHCHWHIVVFTEVEDADIRTNENDLDEFHPKSTRTLFVGNLEKDTTVQDLIGKFSPFGDVIVSIWFSFVFI